VLVEVDPEVGGEYEGEAAPLLEGSLAFVGGEIGADQGGVGAVEEGGKAVGRTVAEEVRGLRGEGAAYEGEVQVREGRAVRATSASSGAGGEEQAQPVEGARDKVVHVDAPCKRWPCPGRSSHLAGVCRPKAI
jgi:hypothetical protein